jgi:hypothetical protein
MTICSNCRNENSVTAAFCGFCGSKLSRIGSKISQIVERSYIDFLPDGQVIISAQSALEAKLALKELKLEKKKYRLLKKQITEQERQIRATYTDHIRQRGSKFQGGQGLGRFIRRVQTDLRDNKRRSLALELAPLEQEKRRIENMIESFDKAILEVELFIFNNA